MAALPKKAVNTYRREGLTGIVNGGLDLLLSTSIPAYCKKKSIQQNWYIDKLNKRSLGTPLNRSILTRMKSSDTVFILGSGSSINQISEAGWDVIDDHDSMGLNRWPIHDFVPTYLIFEMPSLNAGREMRRQYWELLEIKKADYEETRLILKDVDRFFHTSSVDAVPDWLTTGLMLSPDIELPPLLGDSRERFRTVLRCIDERNYLAQDGRIDQLFKKRGSVSYTLFLATILGYERIVLCGVDMVDSKYFWDERRKRLNQEGIPIPEPHMERDPEKVHNTNDASRQGIPLEQIIYDIDEKLLRPNGIELYTETKRSALHPKVPHFEIL